MKKTELYKKQAHTPGPRLKSHDTPDREHESDPPANAPASGANRPAGAPVPEVKQSADTPGTETDGMGLLPPIQEAGSSMPPRRWFLTFMCMNIPIAGWIYLLRLAFGKKRNQLRDFAKAYLLYKLVFLAVALVLLGILIYIGLDLADKLLTYMEML